MATATRNQQALEPAVEQVRRFCDYVRDVPAAQLDAAVPGLEWDVRGVVAHVTSILRRYTVDLERAEDRAALAARNAGDVTAIRAELGDDIDAMAADIEQQLDLIVAFAPSMDPDEPRKFHLGATVDLPAAWSNLISEVLVHGDDIARATGRSFTVPPSDLEGVWRHLMPVSAAWLRPEASAARERYELTFEFGTIHLVLDAGTVAVTDPTGAADHVISAGGAVETTLSFPFRRRLITDPALALLASRFHDI